MNSIQLYKKLLEDSLDRLLEFTKRFPRHERQFTFDKLNEVAFYEMYKNLKEVVPRHELFSKVPGLEEACRGCWAFYLNPRNESIKFMDIRLGKEFEKVLADFFNSIKLKCMRSEDLGLKENYPDVIVFGSNGKPVAFLEVKYLTAPFVKVFEKVPGRECYEGSTTLDVGKKLETQRKIVEEEIDVPVFYVYWLDYPCMKGIFCMPAEEVFSYIDKKELEWTRRVREGNFVQVEGKRVRVGHIKKVYLPLLKMSDFEELVRKLHKLVWSSKNVKTDKSIRGRLANRNP